MKGSECVPTISSWVTMSDPGVMSPAVFKKPKPLLKELNVIATHFLSASWQKLATRKYKCAKLQSTSFKISRSDDGKATSGTP